MKAIPLLAATAAVVMAAPAFAQDAPAPPPSTGTAEPNFLSFKDAPFLLDDPRRDDGQCFNGRTVVGMSRAGDTLYLQAKGGRVFRMKVVDDCPALDGADKVDVRSDGAQVCSGVSATLRVKTTTGFKSCRVNYVRRVNGADVATR